MNFNSDIAKMAIARFYDDVRMESPAKWNIENGKLKKSTYPSADEIMELLNNDNWSEIQSLSKQYFSDYALKFDIEDKQELKYYLGTLIRKSYLIQQIKPYVDKVTSNSEYNKSRKALAEKGIALPSVQLIIHYFEKWNNFKEFFSLDINGIGSQPKYDRDEVLSILKKHGSNLNSQNWAEHAKQLGLPSLSKITSYITHEELEQYTLFKKSSYSRDELLKIAWEHQEHFIKPIRDWTAYAKENKLPSIYNFQKEFTKEQLKYIKSLLKNIVNMNELLESEKEKKDNFMDFEKFKSLV